MNSTSVYQGLSDEIVQNQNFAGDYRDLIADKQRSRKKELNLGSVKRLLESASILACTDDDNHKALALSIAGTVMEGEYGNEVLEVSSDLILLRLGIFPSLEMAVQRHGDVLRILKEDGNERTPLQLYLEILHRKQANQTQIGDEKVFFLDFQMDILRLLREKKNISISAPTSAGKSFVLTRYVVDVLTKKKQFSVFYIVPTRALIAQIQREFRDTLHKFS